MKITEFKSGIYEQQYEYKSFLPNKINIQWELSPELSMKLSEADRKLGELNAFSLQIPNVDFFIQMHIAKEAKQSNKIEGTQTNMEEIFLKKEDILAEKQDDWQEVQNYIIAINSSIKKLEKLPISTRLICQAHKILLDGVRGEHKTPGEYRTSQNWIGPSLKDAYYIPPSADRIQELMNDLEKFINNNDVKVPYLVKIAIVHYQFETIHPYLDGNGRIGRLIITLSLVSMGVLTKPSLYLSDYFEKNRSFYIDNLQRARTHNDLNNWVKFFLDGIIETAQNSIDTFKKIIELQGKINEEILPRFSSRKIVNVNKLLQILYRYPIITINKVSEDFKISFPAARDLINDFRKKEILKELTGYKRNQVFIFEDYLNLF